MNGNAMKTTAIAFLKEFSGGDRAAAWRRASDDVIWTINQHNADTNGLAVFNRDQYSAMVESSEYLFPNGISLEVTGALADGDRVALEARGNGALADGRIYANHYVFTFRFRDDKISEITEYLDTAYAQTALAFVMEVPA